MLIWAFLGFLCLSQVPVSTSIECYSCMYLQGDKTGFSSSGCYSDPPNIFSVSASAITFKPNSNGDKRFSSIFESSGPVTPSLVMALNIPLLLSRFGTVNVNNNPNATAKSKTRKIKNDAEAEPISDSDLYCYQLIGTLIGKEIVIRGVAALPKGKKDEFKSTVGNEIFHIQAKFCKGKKNCNDANTMAMGQNLLGLCLVAYGFTRIY